MQECIELFGLIKQEKYCEHAKNRSYFAPHFCLFYTVKTLGVKSNNTIWAQKSTLFTHYDATRGNNKVILVGAGLCG